MNHYIKLLTILILLLFPINTAVIQVSNQYSTFPPAVITWPGMSIDSNCYIYMPGGICSQCNFGYYFDKDRCVVGQRNCKKYNPFKNTCLSCYVGSQLLNDTCAINRQAYLLQGCYYFKGNQCLECSKGYYFNYDGVCELIDTLCDQFDYNSKLCKKCFKGYTYQPNRGECVASGLQLNSYCSSWQNNRCLGCIKNYQLNQLGQCIESSRNCKENNPTNPHTCLSCYNGYLLINGNCQYDPRYISNLLCSKFNENGTCASCNYRSILDSNNQCITINPLCLTYDINGFCLSCYQSYQLFQNSCILSKFAARNRFCSYWQSGICISCIPWTYLDSSNTCQLVNSLCRSFNQQNGDCTSCYGGYLLQDGKCNLIQVNPYCLTFSSSNNCTACYNGYYLNNQTKICQQADSLCLTITEDNKCLSCFNGFRLLNNRCVIYQQNCLVYNQKGFCFECNIGFHNYYQQCLSNQNNCIDYNSLLGICNKCQEKYINSNGFCSKNNSISSIQPQKIISSGYDPNCALWSNGMQICLSCNHRSFYNNMGLCQRVSDFCLTFNTNNGSCLGCYKGFSISNGLCIPDNKSCDSSDQQGLCLSCYVGYYLQSGECKLIDPLCQNFNTKSLSCEKCYEGYQVINSTCIIKQV